MTLGTEEDTLIWRRKLCIALSGGIVLEEAVDLSSDRLLMNVYPVDEGSSASETSVHFCHSAQRDTSEDSYLLNGCWE
jgi:hypothetical protein